MSEGVILFHRELTISGGPSVRDRELEAAVGRRGREVAISGGGPSSAGAPAGFCLEKLDRGLGFDFGGMGFCCNLQVEIGEREGIVGVI